MGKWPTERGAPMTSTSIVLSAFDTHRLEKNCWKQASGAASRMDGCKYWPGVMAARMDRHIKGQAKGWAIGAQGIRRPDDTALEAPTEIVDWRCMPGNRKPRADGPFSS